MGGGRSHPRAPRLFFEPRFGADFSSVRIHSDNKAAELARSLNAKAFTFGRNIVFGPGQYGPGTKPHDRLLAHELTHVIQQQGGGASHLIRAAAQNGLEETRKLRRNLDEPETKEETSNVESGSEASVADAGGEPSVRVEAPIVTAASEEEGPEPEEAEEPEEERQPEKYFRVVNKRAYVRDTGKIERGNIRKVPLINNDWALLRDPDNDMDAITFSSRAEADVPEGAELKKARRNVYKLVIPRSTRVEVIGEAVLNGVQYQRVEWGKAKSKGWIKKGNTSDAKLKLPTNTLVDVKEKRGRGRGKVARIKWDEQEGWTAYSNLAQEWWHLKYATRFSDKERKGREMEFPKSTRLKFEEDGTILLAKVTRRNAFRHDENDGFERTRDRLVRGTPCIVLEQRGRYSRVLDYAGTWNAEGSPPGWWTKTFKLKRYKGRVDLDAIQSESVRKYLEESQPAKGAADVAIHYRELRKAGKLIGQVFRGDASKRTAEGVLKRPLRENYLPKGAYLILEEKEVSVQGAKFSISRIIKLDDTGGQEYWVRSTFVPRVWLEHAYSIEKDDGGLSLVMRRKLARKVGGTIHGPEEKSYKITRSIAKMLRDRYLEEVSRVIDIEGNNYSRNQKELLRYAKAFATEKEPKVPEESGLSLTPLNKIVPRKLVIPEEQIRGDEMELNKDLINRMNKFYQFISHTNLISGAPRKMWGIRARTKAHELSTKWTLHPRSGKLRSLDRRIEFVRRLVSLGQAPDASGIYWLPQDKMHLLDVAREAIELIDFPENYKFSTFFGGVCEMPPSEESAERSGWIARILEALGIKSERSGEQEGTPVCEETAELRWALDGAYALIDEIVKECRNNVQNVGNRKAQTAPANEGFPTWERDLRRPNTNDTTGVSNHVGGEAIDITFPFYFNYYDPIVDAIALHFGLYRPVKDARNPEHWHYERVGISLGQRGVGGVEQSPLQSGD